MTSESDEEKGKQLLSAVERLISSDEKLIEVVEQAQETARERSPEASKQKETLRELTAQQLTRIYSNRAAIAGGAASVPALIPGFGSIAAAVAGTFAELAYVLKCEVELCLSISHVYGFDIAEPKERQLAFLMAAVSTYDSDGKNFFADIVRAEATAIWNYGPRVLSGMVIKAMAVVAVGAIGRGFLKMIPVLGIAIGGGMNKVLTQRVGNRLSRDFRQRRELMRAEVTAPEGTRLKKKTKRKSVKKKKKEEVTE
ncbi:MAG: EcsC family protein [Archangium sp.]|nr:EcsC family protein [Archangium sp.]